MSLYVYHTEVDDIEDEDHDEDSGNEEEGDFYFPDNDDFES